MNWAEKLKHKWGTPSNWQVLSILLVFACTGISSLYLKQGLYFVASITEDTAPWIRITYRIVATLITYQILLLAFGWLFGQFRFFWQFEKKMFSRFLKKNARKK